MDIMKRCRVRWHVGGGGTAIVGRPEVTWQCTVSTDMRLLGVDSRYGQDHLKWREIGWFKSNSAVPGTTSQILRCL